MVWPGANCNTITWSGSKRDLMFRDRLPFVTLSLRFGTKCNNILPGTTVTNVIPLGATTLVAPNVRIMTGLILVMVPNAVPLLSPYFHFGLIQKTAQNQFPDSLSINIFCAQSMIEKSIDRE